MFGSDIIEVVIGLSFAFFSLSVVASAAQELVSQLVSWRARTLKDGIGKLLSDPTFTGIAKEVYEHPLVSSVGRPSYLKSVRFADSLLTSLHGAASISQMSVTTVLDGIDKLPEGDAKRQLQLLAWQSGDSLEGLQKSVATWFDDSMDRVSGAYKRNSQKVLLVLGIGMAVLFNVDALDMAQTLVTNPSIRSAIVGAATTAAGTTDKEASDDAIQQLRDISPAIGWSVCWYPTAEVSRRDPAQLPAPCGVNRGGVWPSFEGWLNYSVLRLPGWLFSGLAVMLGAPFWFDTLTRFANLRATGKVEDGKA